MMRNTEGQIGAGKNLYSLIQPYDYHILDVGDGHKIYIEECGNPNGIPVVVLHGGPGAGCSPGMRRFFNPEFYRIILFDQRGCGRSKPHASVESNTTWHLVNDVEKIRKLLLIKKWIVFGGSWGATLALIYSQAHPTAVKHLVLRGVFLMTDLELDWFYNGGAGMFFPKQWKKLIDLLMPEDQKDVICSYHTKLFQANEKEQTKYARAWTEWETALATMHYKNINGTTPAAYARAFARIESHYFVNKGFLNKDDKILDNMHKIDQIPGTIIHGRYDMICPPLSAYKLHNAWEASELHIIENAGHSLSEQGISSALVSVMDDLIQYNRIA